MMEKLASCSVNLARQGSLPLPWHEHRQTERVGHTFVLLVSHLFNEGAILALCRCLTKVTIVRCEKSQFNSTKLRRFPPDISVFCRSDTEAIKGGPNCIFWENGLVSWIIQ